MENHFTHDSGLREILLVIQFHTLIYFYQCSTTYPTLSVAKLDASHLMSSGYRWLSFVWNPSVLSCFPNEDVSSICTNHTNLNQV